MRWHHIEPVYRYVFVVCASGMAIIGVFGFGGDFDVRGLLGQLWLLVLLVVLGELLPIINVTRGGETHALTTSTTFSFAIMIGWGLAPALIAQALGSLIGDALHRKTWWKAIFNVSQYALSLSAGYLVMTNSTVLPSADLTQLRVQDMFGVIAAIAAMFVANSVITGSGLALAEKLPIFSYLKSDLTLLAIADGSLLLLSPVIVLLVAAHLGYVLLILLPMGTVYAISQQNGKLVGNLRRQAEENEYQALHDALTDLPNRTLLHDRLHQAILAAQREGHSVAIMLMDLDRFKEVNDSLGHHNGDLLLQQAAGRLAEVLRQSDSVARLGGDEFAVLLPKVTEHSAVTTAADKLLKALERPFLIEGLTLEIGGSIGIALYPAHGVDADTLLQRADVAMYAAKNSRVGWELYASEQDNYSPGRLTLVAELRRAIDHDELIFFYQPKASLKTGQIQGVEALVRWQHPQQGLIFPDEFIPLAEHTGLVRPLTSAALDASLKQCSEWHQQGLALYVAVNVSAHSLLDLHFPEECAALLKKWEVPAPWLKLEITESSIMADPMRALRVLTKLHAMGVGLAIDDFGTGYTSLSYLKRLPVNEIKIDKAFVMNMLNDDNDDVIVRSIIDLGRNLGLEVIAEGVETKESWDRLARYACDTAQGYFLSRPLPAQQITQWIESYSDEQLVPVFAPPSAG